MLSRSTFSGFFLIGFLLVAAGMALPHLRALPLTADLLTGKEQMAFEKQFNSDLPGYEPIRNFWGRSEYALWHEGRTGVVLGDDGWLFSSEEFSCPRDARQNITDNTDYVNKTIGQLEQKQVRVILALVPEKARVMGLALPSCRAGLYQQLLDAFKAHNVANLLTALQASAAFMKTDTHWSPAGAALAAAEIATLAGPAGERQDFVTQAGETKPYNGDLLRYLPGVSMPETLATPATENRSVTGLLDDSVPAITLVGTSYSANPRWNFDGALKTALQADVLNMADEGLGPFAVMDKYLQSRSWQDNPPRMLVWEMPERYFVAPHGVFP